MTTTWYPEDSNNPSDRTRRRLAELKRKHGETIAKAQRYSGRDSSCKAERAPTVACDQKQSTGLKQQHDPSRLRKESRRAMHAMTKTVEIADGSSDFHSLMVAAYGKEVMRAWKFAKEVFENATGLTLIKETEEGIDS